MQFSDIYGLEDVKSRLTEAVRKDHVAHAQLFLGPEGSANLAMAIAFTSYLNCLEPEDHDSCGKCASCLKNGKYIHPDVHYVFPVSSTDKIKGKDVVSHSFLTEWRQFLEEDLFGDVSDWSLIFGGENKNLNISKEESRGIIQKLSLKAFEGRYKVIIVWMPEYMHPAAANGLLKVLEEPSDNTIFIMVANDAEKLLGTILSRLQMVFIRGFDYREIEEQLLSSGIPASKALHISRLSEGSLKMAYRMASEDDDDQSATTKEWFRLCYGSNLIELVKWSEDFHKMSRVTQRAFLRFGLSLLRDTLVAHYGDSSLIKLSEEEKNFVKKFSQVITPEKVGPLTKLLSEALFHLERNASAKMVFLDLSIKVSSLMKKSQVETYY
jgi:DNA polymerase-3 subunit delta'